jgi:ATP-dependent RNA helicase SUPV3L1/SUV3
VRVDILERLADLIRPLIALDATKHQGELPKGAAPGNGFRVTVEMTSLLGTAGEDFASILNALGYRVRRTPKAAPTTPVEGISSADAGAAPVGDAVAAPAAAPDPDDDGPDMSIADAIASPATSPAADTADAVVNEAAMDAVEGVVDAPAAPAAAEVAAVDTATADLGAPAPDAEAKPAEPEFDEIWFPAGRRPDNPRHRPNRPPPRQGQAAEGADGEQRQPRRHGKPRNGDARPPRNGDAKDRPLRENRRANGNGGDSKPYQGKPNRKDRDFEDRPPREKRDRPFDPDSPFAALAVLRNQKSE